MDSLSAQGGDAAEFWFFACQAGAERALKGELARRCAEARFAYSRPGFLTFKAPAAIPLEQALAPPLVFSRAAALSLGKASGMTAAERAQSAWRLAAGRKIDRLHVWQRDSAPVGYRGFEPGPTPLSAAVEAELLAAAPRRTPTGIATLGEQVLDCVVVEPEEWWIGVHLASHLAACWPGGAPPLVLPTKAISRAYLKMEEAMLWSELPLVAGDRCAEIGCSPGGASQALLARGLHVLGIDPAQVDPALIAHPAFEHLRKRGAEVKIRECRDIRWLIADMNVAPNYTLDTVERIVTHDESGVEGMLLTLKLLDWNLAEEIPRYLARIESWGFPQVRARQLAHNRQEICVAASRAGRGRSSARRAARAERPGRGNRAGRKSSRRKPLDWS